jgi:hypothetical protein
MTDETVIHWKPNYTFDVDSHIEVGARIEADFAKVTCTECIRAMPADLRLRMISDDELEADLVMTALSLRDGIRTFRENHEFLREREPWRTDLPAEAMMDANGRPILADMHASHGQVLAALAAFRTNHRRVTP